MITGYINGQRLNLAAKDLAGESIAKLTASFKFSPEWEGMTKVAYFSNEANTYPFLLTDGCISATQNLNLIAGKWSCFIWGYDVGEVTDIADLPEQALPRLTTTVAELYVHNTGIPGNDPIDIEPATLGEQILAVAVGASGKVDDLERRADSGEFNGKDGYTPVKGIDYRDGVDGYTPVKGVDYRDGVDGYTPVKGVDYFDGKDGKDGADNLLIAECGVTTAAEVAAALNAGKTVVARKESLWYQMVRESLGNEYSFVSADRQIKLYHVATLNNAGWTYADYQMPSNVTSSTVSGWGFTKNTGDYSKPVDGIPESDLSEDVQNKLNSGGGGSSVDVQINGTSIVKDGVANIPVASSGLGAVWISGGGLKINSSTGWLYVQAAGTTEINSRSNYYPIAGTSLDYAVKAAMTDGKGAAWTEAEQLAAQARLGIISSEGVGF